MSKGVYISGRDQGKVYLDVVDVNVSVAMRKALSDSTGAPTTSHMLLDRSVIPLLQGIAGASQNGLKNEAITLTHQVQTNGIVIVCPGTE